MKVIKMIKTTFIFLFSMCLLGCSNVSHGNAINSDQSQLVDRSTAVSTMEEASDLYRQQYKNFTKNICQPSDEKQFQALYKEYKKQGFYVPILDGQLAKGVINNSLKLLGQRDQWITEQITKISSSEKLPETESIVDRLNTLIDANLKIKYLIEVELKKDESLLEEARKIVKQFKNLYTQYEDANYYLLNFAYPIDHLKNRLDHDHSQNPEAKLLLYVQRKLYEDGAMNPDQTSSDVFLRTALDTFNLNLKKQDLFFTPDVVLDWEWIQKNAQVQRSRGKEGILARLNEWKDRNTAQVVFYQGLLNQNKEMELNYVHDLSIDSQNLKSFVEGKLAQVYSFWLKQPEELKRLYVLQTILTHEVGGVDPTGIERKTVAQVVMNRAGNSAYHNLSAKDPMQILVGDPVGELLKQPKHWWLNVMFRRAEFSFTLFFIPSVLRVFCPSTQSDSEKLLEENLQIALQVLRTPNPDLEDHDIYRYFSRVSMMGRIDMTSVWNDFLPVGERPGYLVSELEHKNLSEYYQKHDFRYINFFDYKSVRYLVLEIQGKRYSVKVDQGMPQFYNYRHPDYFRYFKNLSVD